MHFTKLQGCGNDYLFVDLTGGREFPGGLDAAPDVARRVSDRRFGVGSDGLILVTDPPPGLGADVGMVMFNADGSRAQMCGNGFRGLCKLVHDRGIAAKPVIKVMTDAGLLSGKVEVRDGKVVAVTADLGVPRLNRGDLPMEGPPGPAIDARIKAAGVELVGTAVSMGNPHFVVFIDGDVDEFPVAVLGPAVEGHQLFPQRVNTEFVQVLSPTEVRQRTWERGSGETLACGTGAAAVAVAGIVTGRLRSPLTVHLRGGDLRIEWEGKGKPVLKTGPSVEVFTGEWDPAA